MPGSDALEHEDLAQLRARVAELEAQAATSRGEAARAQRFAREGSVAKTWFGPDGTIVLINALAAANLRGTPETLVGRRIGDILPAYAERTMERIAATFRGETHEYDATVNLPSGQRSFTSTYHPVRDGDGRIIAAQLVAHDVTRLRTAEETLRRNQAVFDAAQRRVRLGIWSYHPRAGLLTLSDHTGGLLGCAPGEAPRSVEAFLALIHPEDRTGLAACMDRARDGIAAQPVEFRTAPDRGETRWLSLTAELSEVEGDDLRVDGTILDVTAQRRVLAERAELQRQMQHAQKLESLGVLAGGIAHDFNNLLVTMMGYTELALLELAGDAPARAHLREVLSSTQRAADLCSQMLAYSGHGQFVIRKVDLSATVRGMAHLLEVSVSKTATMVSDLPENLPAIEADTTQIGQIVMNLITNASEAIGTDRGRVHLRTGARTCDRAYLASCFVDDDLPAGPYVFLEVDDTGRGMDDETRQRMFDPFFSSKATGRGLGLAAVLGIIRGHNGAIRVDSALGRGTTITVLFPATGGPADASLPTGDHEPVPRGSGSVMVVDDEPGVRSLVEQVLERAGYAVYCACDGLEAVEFMREHPAIDLVLLDVTMPRLDGRDTFRQLREIAPELRVILMSGYDEQSAVPGLVREPSSTFLQKPFRPSTLLERVRRMLAGDGSPPAP